MGAGLDLVVQVADGEEGRHGKVDGARGGRRDQDVVGDGVGCRRADLVAAHVESGRCGHGDGGEDSHRDAGEAHFWRRLSFGVGG